MQVKCTIEVGVFRYACIQLHMMKREKEIRNRVLLRSWVYVCEYDSVCVCVQVCRCVYLWLSLCIGESIYICVRVSSCVSVRIGRCVSIW